MPRKARAGGSSRNAMRLSAPSGSPVASKRAAEATRESMAENNLRVRRFRQHRFYVRHRSPVYRLDRPDPDAMANDLVDCNAVQPQRVWSVRRAGRKNAGERRAHFPAWMNFQCVPLGLVQPRDDDEFL